MVTGWDLQTASRKAWQSESEYALRWELRMDTATDCRLMDRCSVLRTSVEDSLGYIDGHGLESADGIAESKALFV